MTGIMSFAFVLVVFAIADLVATKTKSIVSSMFTCSVIFIVGFWLGVPQTVFQDSTLQSIGALLIPCLLVHMGTMISLQQLKEQWKTVVIATAAVVGIALVVLGIGQFLMDRDIALVAAPVISGGVIAALKMQDAMAAAGVSNADALAVFATVLMVMEGFVGYPVASFVLKKEARRIKKEIDAGTYEVKTIETKEKKRLIKQLPEEYRSENYYLAKVAIVGALATALAFGITKVTGTSIVDKNILSLLLGIVMAEIGFLENDVLTKANANGLAIAALMAAIFASLSKATPEVLLNLLPAILISQVLGVIGYVIFGVIVGKMLKVSPWISIAIGSTVNYGFPGTYIISKEVSNALGETPEQKELILESIMPKMLVAGFITVSIASVFLASIIATLI